MVSKLQARICILLATFFVGLILWTTFSQPTGSSSSSTQTAEVTERVDIKVRPQLYSKKLPSPLSVDVPCNDLPSLVHSWRNFEIFYQPHLVDLNPEYTMLTDVVDGKYKAIADFAKRFNLDLAVETGTAGGGFISYAHRLFKHIWTMEVVESGREYLEDLSRNMHNVTLLFGNSAELLPSVMRELGGPAVFWLDGHWDGPRVAMASKFVTPEGFWSPIVEELDVILGADAREHVVLVDDARLFHPSAWQRQHVSHGFAYPSLADVMAVVCYHRPHWKASIKDDILRMHA